MSNLGKLIIFSAPSGAGKTTLVHNLLRQSNKLAFSISCTTRMPRQKETDGLDYYFISLELFKQKIDNNEFLEWEEVYVDNFYGTLKSEITRIWANDQHVIFDIDTKGGLNIKQQYPWETLAIFVMPPSLATLKERLINRNTESEEKLAQRISKADEEIMFANQFDTILVNDDLAVAKKESERLVFSFINS